MARDLNKVMLIGRLGKDPEVKYTQGGTAVATLSVATSSSIKRDDKWEDETEWHRVVAWGRLAEVAGEYMSKGTLVFIEGRLKTRSWEDRDGNKRHVTEIVAATLSMLGGNQGAGQTQQPRQEARQAAPPQQGQQEWQAPQQPEHGMDDVPF